VTGRGRSLRRRLTVGVVLTVGLSVAVFSVVLYATFRRALWRQFDQRLAQDARAVANMVEERADGPWEFEPAALEEFERKFGAAYFEIWMDDGTVVARSPSLGTSDLRHGGALRGPIVTRTILPDGRNGRIVETSLPPRHDEEGPPKPSGRRLSVAVARATDEVDAALAAFRLLLWASALAALGLAALGSAVAVRGGLGPVAQLAKRIDALDARHLGERLPVEHLPRELQPTVAKLNELLGRLEESFKRERRFSADVSHELRTPIAGLRSTLEVAASRPRSPSEYQATIREGLQAALQMSSLVENLLMLARIEANHVHLAETEIVLRDLVEESFEPFAAKASARALRFENLVPSDASIVSDREKLRIVVTNLLANAVEYTTENGWVTVEAAASPEAVIAVCDSGPQIPRDALDRIFDRFFRLDPARTGTGEHSGVGLALARALCDTLGLSLAAENRPDGSVAFRIRRSG
jgi:two-component system heavy metal sensor histidine kinase CusS